MLSAIVITRNEERMISDCLESLSFADEIIVVDTGNTDRTNQLARKFHARIVKSSGEDYSRFRNDGLNAASGNWILYVDADERVSPGLKQEIMSIMRGSTTDSVYALPRQNQYLGKIMHFGGWGNDYVIRFFFRNCLTGWRGELHEQPEYHGNLIKLKAHLTHISHRDLSSMVEKTINFTAVESQLRMESGHPQMVWWRFPRVMFSEFWLRFIRLKAFKDGPEGIIDGLFQVFNTFIIYARLWELQHESGNL